jgi:hypothetical protein
LLASSFFLSFSSPSLRMQQLLAPFLPFYSLTIKMGKPPLAVAQFCVVLCHTQKKKQEKTRQPSISSEIKVTTWPTRVLPVSWSVQVHSP